MPTENEFTPIKTAITTFNTGLSWVAVDKIRELSWEEMLSRPQTGLNHIYWILGHIIASLDISQYIDGSDSVIDDKYLKLFDMGTLPEDNPEQYIEPATMLDDYNRAVEKTVHAIESLDPEDLSKPPAKELPEPLKPYFPTRFDLIAGFATHITYHAGQIGTLLKHIDLLKVETSRP